MVFRKQDSIYDVITHMNKMEIVNETCQKTGAALTDITVVRRTQGSSTGRPNDIQIGSIMIQLIQESMPFWIKIQRIHMSFSADGPLRMILLF